MVLRTLCGLALFTLSVPLACSSGAEDSGSDGGSSGAGGSAGKGGAGKGGGSGTAGEPSGGSDSSGGEPGGGGSSAGGEPGMPGGGEGGAPLAMECGENDISTSGCEVVGSICQAADRCCRCIDFPSAPSCGSLWDCVRLDLNMEDCPENPPPLGEPCTMPNLGCSYCLDDGPHYFYCGRLEVGSDEGEWNEGDGLSCNE